MTINLWDAIARMRFISKKKGAFSFVFMSYSRQRRTSEGIVEIANARLLPNPKPAVGFSDYMLRFVDLDTGEERRCWQPCIMYFNDLKVTLSNGTDQKRK